MNSFIEKIAGGGGRKIPSLDGLRALSIALVLIGHLAGTRNFPLGSAALGAFDLNFGNLGVRVFFVISGFLITSLLMDELSKTGTISLKQFYLRRTFRIFPPFYVFLAAILLLALTGILSVPWKDFVSAATYTMNFIGDRGWSLGHLWSLAVEEQFYLLWPFVLASLGLRSAMRAAAFVVVVSPLVRIGLAYAMPSQLNTIGNSFYTIADPLAVGCLLAGSGRRLTANLRYQEFLRSPWIHALGASIIVVNALPWTKLNFLIFQSYVNIAIAVCLDSVVRYPNTRSGYILNLGPVRAIGVLSYSLYLWQQLFVDRNGTYWWNTFPANLVLAIAAAIVSFFFVERPTLALRKRVESHIRNSENG